MYKGYNQIKSNQNFDFLKNKIGSKYILFLKETQSSVEKEKKWIENLMTNLLFTW